MKITDIFNWFENKKNMHDVVAAEKVFYEKFRNNKDEIKKSFETSSEYHLEINLADDTLIIEIYSKGKKVHKCVVLYGDPYAGKNAMYIDEMYRFTDERLGLGSKILDGISKLAETFDFKYIGVHAIAAESSVKGALSQSQLEQWYIRHLGSKEFDFSFYNSIDDFRCSICDI